MVCRTDEYPASNDIRHALYVALPSIAQIMHPCNISFQQQSNESSNIPIKDLN